MKVKLCGVRRAEDIEYLNEFLPDYAGFVFADSPRRVTRDEAAALSRKLDGRIKRVGVFVNEPLESLLQTAKSVPLDVIQLHGDEGEGYLSALHESTRLSVWKAVRVRSIEDIARAQALQVQALVLDSFQRDAYGGTGRVANWKVIQNISIKKPYFLAGGLNAQNIEEAIESLHPYGVDLSGGIETGGVKDSEKIAAVMTRVMKYRSNQEKRG